MDHRLAGEYQDRNQGMCDRGGYFQEYTSSRNSHRDYNKDGSCRWNRVEHYLRAGKRLCHLHLGKNKNLPFPHILNRRLRRNNPLISHSADRQNILACKPGNHRCILKDLAGTLPRCNRLYTLSLHKCHTLLSLLARTHQGNNRRNPLL
jgi:hypothetical protein